MRRRASKVLAAAMLASGLSSYPVVARTIAVEEHSIDQLQEAMRSGAASSVELTRAYLARIAAMDRKGPTLRSIIAHNPEALGSEHIDVSVAI